MTRHEAALILCMDEFAIGVRTIPRAWQLHEVFDAAVANAKQMGREQAYREMGAA